ncbi:unnamed protein product, partial [Prorocentrum cordatum]
ARAMATVKASVPACGFGVGATKKGELPLRVEKRARGKKVTVIPNVTGDASKLARALQTMLGVGGTVRQVEGGAWAVEVQGEQVGRVTRALLDFRCLQGLTKVALERLQESIETGSRDADSSVVARSVATKFLARTQEGKASTKEDRQKALAMEAEFYGHYWDTAVASSVDDFSDVWEETLAADGAPGTEVKAVPVQSEVELTFALKALGMFPETGRAVKEFWEKNTGMTVAQFRKMALNPGARFTGEGPAQKEVPSNLVSRQKVSDRKAGGGRTNYFSYTCSVIDAYQRGIAVSKDTESEPAPAEAEEPKMGISSDEEGWCTATMHYVLPFQPPSTRLDAEECARVSSGALSKIEKHIREDLDRISGSLPGVECCLDSSSFRLDLKLHEREFLHAGKRDTGGKPLDNNAKEELRLEKKLREIAALKRRQVEGETLEKLQVEKVLKRGELFEQVAELKLRRAEKELRRLFKSHSKRFQEAFWDCEHQALFGGGSAASAASSSAAMSFGTFDEGQREGPVTLSSDGTRAEGAASRWAGVGLHLLVRGGEVGAFAVEVLEGLVRLGWAAQGAGLSDLGADDRSFGFGGSGEKVHRGVFEPYGRRFTAGDVIHCEVEREASIVRLGFALNSEPLGIAYEAPDELGDDALAGAVCGQGFKVRLLSAECMPLEDAPGLVGFVEYDPPRMAQAVVDFRGREDECLQMWAGETVNVSADDGRGWLFGFFLDAEDPDDGGWFPAEGVRFLDVDPAAAALEEAEEDAAWGAAPAADAWGPPPAAPAEPEAWGAAPAAAEDEGVEWGCGEEIPGLAEWLRGLALQKYEAQATAWCREMGAVSTREVEENWEEFAGALGLRPLERTRLRKRATAGAA